MRAGRWLCLLLALLVLPSASAEDYPPVDSSAWGKQYDEYFKKYSKRYFGPGFDWRWFKAQAIAESRLNHNAKSHVGAIGVMQLMPATYAEIRDKNPHFKDISTPRWNIAAGIYYNRYLFTHQVWDGMPDEEKLLVAFAAYNAGLGGVLKAHRKLQPKRAKAWQEIAPHSPRETRGYVKRIKHIKGVAAMAHKNRDPRAKGASGISG